MIPVTEVRATPHLVMAKIGKVFHSVVNLLQASSRTYEYTKITLPREMPALLSVVEAANAVALYGFWRDGNFVGFANVIWINPEDADDDVPILEFVLNSKYYEEGLQDTILETLISLCLSVGCTHVRAFVHKENFAAQHCFFRHGFRPAPTREASGLNDPTVEWVSMSLPIVAKRQELTFVRYYRDLHKLRGSLQRAYPQDVFSDQFVADHAAFIGEYVI
jgi:RimJ/RimL family protein N-acetyltransferase